MNDLARANATESAPATAAGRENQRRERRHGNPFRDGHRFTPPPLTVVDPGCAGRIDEPDHAGRAPRRPRSAVDGPATSPTDRLSPRTAASRNPLSSAAALPGSLSQRHQLSPLRGL